MLQYKDNPNTLQAIRQNKAIVTFVGGWGWVWLGVLWVGGGECFGLWKHILLHYPEIIITIHRYQF